MNNRFNREKKLAVKNRKANAGVEPTSLKQKNNGSHNIDETKGLFDRERLKFYLLREDACPPMPAKEQREKREKAQVWQGTSPVGTDVASHRDVGATVA